MTRYPYYVISNALPLGDLWYAGPDAINNAIGYARHRSRSHDTAVRVYDEAANLIETHERKGEFKEFEVTANCETVRVRLYYRGGMESLTVEEILTAGCPPQKQKKQGGKDR